MTQHTPQPSSPDSKELLLLADMIGAISGRSSLEKDRTALIIAATQLRRFAGVAQASRTWDQGEHEGCGIDSQRAFMQEQVAQALKSAGLREDYDVRLALATAVIDACTTTGWRAPAYTVPWRDMACAWKHRAILGIDKSGAQFVMRWKIQEQPHHDKEGWFEQIYRRVPVAWMPLRAYLVGRGMEHDSIDQIKEYKGETWRKALYEADAILALASEGKKI